MLNIKDIKRNCRVVLHQKCMNPSSYKTTEELEPFIKVVKAAICDGNYHGQFETINFFTLPGKGGAKYLERARHQYFQPMIDAHFRSLLDWTNCPLEMCTPYQKKKRKLMANIAALKYELESRKFNQLENGVQRFEYEAWESDIFLESSILRSYQQMDEIRNREMMELACNMVPTPHHEDNTNTFNRMYQNALRRISEAEIPPR